MAMPIQALNSVDPKLARGALASTVQYLIGPGIDEIPEPYRRLSAAVLAEARAYLHLDAADKSPETTEKLRSFLAHEISSRVYEGFNKEEITTRLGDQGKLPLGGYHIKASSVFKKAFEKENFSFATRCVRTATLTQHLGSENARGESDAVKGNFSLFISPQKKKNGQVYYVLISAARAGDVLSIDTLWRIFPEYVDITNAKEPIDFFRSFAEQYGIELAINQRPTGSKWLEDFAVFDPKELDIAPDFRGKSPFVLEFMGAKKGDMIIVRYAAAINTKLYRSEIGKI